MQLAAKFKKKLAVENCGPHSSSVVHHNYHHGVMSRMISKNTIC